MSSRFENLKRNYIAVAVFLFNTLVAFCAANLAAYAGLVALQQVWPRKNIVADRHGLDSQSHVYPGMTQADIDQLVRETWSRSVVFEPYTMFKEPASEGRFLNVDSAGFRVSNAQGPWPPSPDHKVVFLFGGSTTFSYGLPDRQALGSMLQDALSRQTTQTVKVYNFGVGAFQSTQERLLFQELLVRGFRPDVAIFVDGLNEFAFPHVPMGTDQLRLMLEDSPVRRLVWLGSAVGRRLPIARLAGDLAARVKSEGGDHVQPVLGEQADLELGVTQRYLANKQQIESVARSYGIATAFVWQPVPFYKYDLTYHPFRSEANSNVASGYQSFKANLPESIGANFLWCADIQEGLKQRLYVDAVHYTAAMNAMLADRVVELMIQRHLLAGANAFITGER